MSLKTQYFGRYFKIYFKMFFYISGICFEWRLFVNRKKYAAAGPGDVYTATWGYILHRKKNYYTDQK